MHFVFLVAAHNEEPLFESLIHKFESFSAASYEVLIVDNGSQDNSAVVLKRLTENQARISYISTEQKGLGLAFRLGMQALQMKNYDKNTWIVFTACDLPFGFTDIESFLQSKHKNSPDTVFIGSKGHKDSKIERDFKRAIMSSVFYLLRVLVLGLRAKDTQGTVLISANYLKYHDRILSSDYFFTTELIYVLKKSGAKIIELPVELFKELRPSSIRPLRDGWRFVKQLIKLRFRN